MIIIIPSTDDRFNENLTGELLAIPDEIAISTCTYGMWQIRFVEDGCQSLSRLTYSATGHGGQLGQP